MTEAPLRPREYCELAKLAAGGRRRVNNKAHGSIEPLHVQLWDAVIASDPEPDEFERVLFETVLELGPADGPARALASEILTDWRWARDSASYTAWLRGRRDRASHAGRGREERQREA
jgi:hypothetical protein